jgi:hypothetical protein
MALVASAAWARPMPAGSSRPSRSQREQQMPLRVVLEMRGSKWSNCVFAGVPLAEAAGANAPIRNEFRAGEPIWARCYFPSAMPLPKMALVDHVYVDSQRQPIWEQAYDHAAPTALSRSLDYADVLRGVLTALPPGPHRIRVEGVLRHKGGTLLYRGEFRYVR